jgi:hypothetical protein
MQLLSLAVLSPDAQRILDDISHAPTAHLMPGGLIFAAAWFLLWIIGASIGSLAMMKEDAHIGAAAAVGWRWSINFLGILLLAGAGYYFAKLRGSPTIATACIVIGAILFLYAALGAPMKVQRLQLSKAASLVLIALIVFVAGQLALVKLLGDPLRISMRLGHLRRITALPAGDASQLLAALRQRAVEKTAAASAAAPGATPAPTPPQPATPRQKSIAERQGELARVYNDLLDRRASLKEGDQAALDAYMRDDANYRKQLDELQRDARKEGKPNGE